MNKIFLTILKNIGAFLIGGVLGILSLIIFISPILEWTIKKDIGLGIIAVAPAIILIYVIIFGIGGGILGVGIYNFAKLIFKLKHHKGTPIKKRIFVALTVSDNLIKEIGKWREKHHNLPVNWVENKNLHITLIPPFYEDEVGIENVKEKLVKFKNSVGEIDLSFNRVDFGPNLENPRLIWTTGETPQKIIGLKENLEKVLNEILRRAQNDNHRQFLLHITMASFRSDNFIGLSIKKLDEKVLWEGTVESLVLMESKLSEKGADYEILEEVEL